jgi:AraC-like DNA-binding protein
LTLLEIQARFHSYDARYEERASVHVGKGSQDDFNEAKSERVECCINRHLQASLLVNPSIRLVDLADVYRYSDQTHLIREFKSFADCTPRDFAASAPAYFELRQNEDWCNFMKQYLNFSYAG